MEDQAQHQRRQWDGFGQTMLTSSQGGVTQLNRRMPEWKTLSGRRKMQEIVAGTMLSPATNPRATLGTGQRQEEGHLHLELQQQQQWLEILLLSLEGEESVEGWTTSTASTCPASPGLRWPLAHGQTPGLPPLPSVHFLDLSTP